MLRKSFTVRAPVDNYAVALDLFLSDVAKNAIRSASGTYVGDGRASKKISLSFSPKFIIISPQINLNTADTVIAGNMLFAMATNPGATWLPASGFIKDGVLSIESDGFTIGGNANINADSVSYLYFVVG